MKLSRVFVAVAALLLPWAALPSRAAEPPSRDYMKDEFSLERVLDWGSRPVWSPDSKRIAFLRDDEHYGPAYELDLASRQVRCLTCQWGAAGHVARIYYLPDNSFLVLASPSLGTAEAKRDGKPEPVGQTDLYWMPADASLPPQPLMAHAAGETAIDYDRSTPGEMRIAWGEYKTKPRMLMGNIVHDGKRAFLVNRTVLHTDPPKDPNSRVTMVETYDFVDDGKSIMFFTVERGRPFNGMYKLDIATGDLAPMPHDGQHNETHSFPNDRYGLEESNRASDPSSPYRGLSAHRKYMLTMMLKVGGTPDAEALGERYGGKTFELYALDWKTGKRRRLTHVSDIGGQAHQSSPARDGRQIVFAMQAPKTGPYAGKDGLYVGTFGKRD